MFTEWLVTCIADWLPDIGVRRAVLLSALFGVNLLAAALVFAHHGTGLGVWSFTLLFQVVVTVQAWSRDGGA